MEELDIADTDIFVFVRCCNLCDPIGFMFCGVETNSTLHMKKNVFIVFASDKTKTINSDYYRSKCITYSLQEVNETTRY